MCGISGILDYASSSKSLKNIASHMADQLVHRGPDAGGVWSEDVISLSHRRLSILDLSAAGAQPMHSVCGRFVLAFNGEIYNHLEIRKDLEKIGLVSGWRGHSDTETLIAGIAKWGLDETLRRAAGMFALALWDREARQMSLARDRMGEKPLYWGWAGRALVFGSELKALRMHPDCPREICPQALAQYLTLAFVPAPLSIHPGIFKLEPGCILRVTGIPPDSPPQQALRPGDDYGTLSIVRYWTSHCQAQVGCSDRVTSAAEAVDLCDVGLRRAVGQQMVADVPLGAFLSGGVDSSLIVAQMQTQSPRPVKTFTIGFTESKFDESVFAAKVAQHLGTDHNTVMVTDADAQSVIPALPYLYDEPFADSSQIPTYLVCRAARDEVSVALSGDGGDELFAGYTRHLWGPRLVRQLGWMPTSVRRVLGAAIRVIPGSVWDSTGRPLGLNRAGEKAEKLAARMDSLSTPEMLYRSILSEWEGRPPLHMRPPAQVRTAIDDPLPGCLFGDVASQMMAQDMRVYLPDDILCKVDRAAMGVSLETRVPFLDPEVIALSTRLATNLKLRAGQGKWVLRQVLDRYVPRKLIDRPKTGFAIPIGDWLRGPLRDWAETLLSQERLAEDGLLDPTPIRVAWAQHLSRERDWSARLWIVLMFQAWRAHQDLRAS